eukprot:2473830-Amphidinium_carterae.1
MDTEIGDCAHPSDATLWNCSFESIGVDNEIRHSPHRLEPAPRERSLEAVCMDHKTGDSDATLWKRSLEAVEIDQELPDSGHPSDAALWNRSLEAVCIDHETGDCAHPSDAALWN